MALFPGSSGARRELLDFMMQGKINKRQTHRPSGWRTPHQDQPVPTSTIPPYFLKAKCPSCRPTNGVKALNLDLAIHMNLSVLTTMTRTSSYHISEGIKINNNNNKLESPARGLRSSPPACTASLVVRSSQAPWPSPWPWIGSRSNQHTQYM